MAPANLSRTHQRRRSVIHFTGALARLKAAPGAFAAWTRASRSRSDSTYRSVGGICLLVKSRVDRVLASLDDHGALGVLVSRVYQNIERLGNDRRRHGQECCGAPREPA